MTSKRRRRRTLGKLRKTVNRILKKHGLAFPKDRKPVPPEAFHDLDHNLEDPTTGDKALENWLRQEVAPAADAMKADPSRGRSISDVCASLSADLSRRAGPNRRAMMKDEIDAMWGHD